MSGTGDNEGIFLRRTPSGFEFASDYDRELGARYGVGTLVRATLHQPRSGKHHRWFQALLRTIWKHQEQFKSPEAVHKVIKYRLGEFDLIYLRDGHSVIDFRSTRYTAMDEGEFRVHVDRVWDVIQTEIIPGLDAHGREQLTKEIDRLLLGTRG